MSAETEVLVLLPWSTITKLGEVAVQDLNPWVHTRTQIFETLVREASTTNLGYSAWIASLPHVVQRMWVMAHTGICDGWRVDFTDFRGPDLYTWEIVKRGDP